MKQIRDKLAAIRELLLSENEFHYANQIENVLAEPDDALKAYIISNQLWGGSGSIADLILKDKHVNRQFKVILAELGEIQIRKGLVNTRTEMWSEAFREWQKI